ncbi:KEOPS complex Pcc1-like subunit [Halovenus sp. WSH3]|uniref:KEOPS complex Pcc1-like subunit n=1 Tax=Halovenus carboxidivorans TaxID=2692199 RepID=A0A6B0TGB5_9EURY|nr:KEOPS complex subunit Pcc1 [Halovenus carboxidivorans]MXR52219.1 KEOPS complex Pcc1-like subunit [Halovenus carboxidivorans]
MTGRFARIETDHGDAETAVAVAQALAPDNTAEMETSVDGSTVVTTIDRESTGGLQSTLDDYVVNLQVAEQLTTTDGDTSTTTTNT